MLIGNRLKGIEKVRFAYMAKSRRFICYCWNHFTIGGQPANVYEVSVTEPEHVIGLGPESDRRPPPVSTMSLSERKRQQWAAEKEG